MTDKKILMVVPYRARDLEGHALIAHRLVRSGNYQVKLTNGYRLATKILEYAPDMLVLDHLSWNFKVEQAALAKRLGMKVVVLPTEGLFHDEEGAVRRAGKLHNAAHLPDRYLTWGDFPRRALLGQALMTVEQVTTVGCPRFDFYNKRFLRLMSKKSDFAARLGFENSDAPLILWATNTQYASRSAAKMLERQTKRAKKPLFEVKEHIEDHKTQFREHSQVILELARRHPQWNFVIKVHPAEWINPYLKMEQSAPNIRVAYDAPVREFLFHADVLLQRNCTTATEAWMFNKPVLNLEIGKYRRTVRREYLEGNHRVYSIDEAEAALIQYLDGKRIPAAQKKIRGDFIADFYFKVDGMAHERCAEIIQNLLSPPNYDEDAQNLKNELTGLELTALKERDDRRLVNRIKDSIGLSRHRTLKFWKKVLRREPLANAGLFKAEPEITDEMVEPLFDLFDKTLRASITKNKKP